MSWLAILLALASLGGGTTPVKPTLKHCNQLAGPAKKKQCKKAVRARQKAKPKRPATSKPDSPASQRDDTPSTSTRSDDRQRPEATPAPSPDATATPEPAPVYPSRLGVELTDGAMWSVRAWPRTLAAGRIDFVTTNVGEDDHNLSVRNTVRDFGRLDLAPGASDTLTLDLAAGSYTLYCSLEGHEEAGMRTGISVR